MTTTESTARVTAAPQVWRTVLSSMRPHSFYWEPFAGSGFIYSCKGRCPSILIEKDEATYKRLQNKYGQRCDVKIINDDALKLLPQLIEGNKIPTDSLIFADPPWPFSTRNNQSYYRHEMTDGQHIDLCTTLKSAPCDVILMSAQNDMYDSLLWGWHRINIPVRCHNKTVDCTLYLNYEPRANLMNPAHVGHDYRERERIKKKVARWRDNFLQCPPHERAAIMAALEQEHARDIATDGDNAGVTASNGDNQWSDITCLQQT